MNDSENEDINYVSGVEPFAQEKSNPSIDAPDEKTLVRLVRVVDEQIKLYQSIDGMKLFRQKDVVLNSDQREVLCNHYVELLLSFKQIINNAINGIKEQQNE